MNESINMTVFFDEPFWVGVFERIENERLSVCKVTFGTEPKDMDIEKFICGNYYMLDFSKAIEVNIRKSADNPKRRQRNAKKQLEKCGIGTKSQQALKKQHEDIKTEHKQIRRERKEEEEKRKFALRKEKRKEKHRGH